MFSIFGAIITSAFSYEDPHSGGGGGGGGGLDITSINLEDLGNSGHGGHGGDFGNSGPYPPSGGYPSAAADSTGGGGYDYTPNQNYEQSHDHHDHHHEHHPEPPKGRWEKKLKWKEDWVSDIITSKNSAIS